MDLELSCVTGHSRAPTEDWMRQILALNAPFSSVDLPVLPTLGDVKVGYIDSDSGISNR